MADAKLVQKQNADADLIANVLMQGVADFEDFRVLDALLDATVLPERRTVILAAWQRAKLRRALDARNIILPAYSL